MIFYDAKQEVAGKIENDKNISIGIEKLLQDENDTNSLVPENNEPIQRRDEHAG